jgi:Glycosyl hydrolases family 18
MRARANQARAWLAVQLHRMNRLPARIRVVGLVLVLALASLAGLTVSGVTTSSADGQGSGLLLSNRLGDGQLPRFFGPKHGSTKPLPKANSAPAPAPPSVANAAPLGSHEVFGFAPYWMLGSSSGFDVNGLTTLAYFSIDANGNGTLDQSGAGWNGYQSQALSDLVTRAHGAGDRVVLTVTQFDQGTLNQLTSDPTAPGTLANALINAIEAKNLDGVNIDFEGEGSADQAGLTNLVTQVSASLHHVDPHWQVTMDTYASSAGDPGGFYNVAALAPAVDGFFVMAYQLNLNAAPGSTSPLTSSMFSDLTTAQQYAAAVPPAKVILGIPYYGEDWATTDGTLTAQATGGEPTTPTYGQVKASGHPLYWDPVTNTGWTSYQVGGQWHETFFEDPTSLYMIAQMAQSFSLGGLGIWTLGMDGNDPAMIAALDGNAPPTKPQLDGPVNPSAAPAAPAPTPTTAPAAGGAGPGATPPSAGSTTPTDPSPPTTTIPGGGGGGAGSIPAGTPTYAYGGRWQAQPVVLQPQKAITAEVLHGPGAKQVGTLTAFTTTDPAFTCLQSEPSLAVWQLPPSSTTTTTTSTTTTTTPGEVAYTVVLTQPTDCAPGSFTFAGQPVVPAAAGAAAPTQTPSSSIRQGTGGTPDGSVASPASEGASESRP